MLLLEPGAIVAADTGYGSGEGRACSVGIPNYRAVGVEVVVGEVDAVLDGQVRVYTLALRLGQDGGEDQDLAHFHRSDVVARGAVQHGLSDGVDVVGVHEGIAVSVHVVDQLGGTVSVAVEVGRAAGWGEVYPDDVVVTVFGVDEALLAAVKDAVGEVVHEGFAAISGDEIFHLKEVFAVEEVEDVVAAVAAVGVSDARYDEEGEVVHRTAVDEAERLLAGQAAGGIYAGVKEDTGVEVHHVSGEIVSNRTTVSEGVVLGRRLIHPSLHLRPRRLNSLVSPQPQHGRRGDAYGAYGEFAPDGEGQLVYGTDAVEVLYVRYVVSRNQSVRDEIIRKYHLLDGGYLARIQVSDRSGVGGVAGAAAQGDRCGTVNFQTGAFRRGLRDGGRRPGRAGVLKIRDAVAVVVRANAHRGGNGVGRPPARTP